MDIDRKTIMIVEDNPKIRQELAIFLNRNGYRALAPDRFDAIAAVVLAESPHLVLLDINLPVYDGYYVCREIRRQSDVPIIVVTSRDSEIDELTAMNLGADDFVTKPYNTQILLMRIASVLKRAYRPSVGENGVAGSAAAGGAAGSAAGADHAGGPYLLPARSVLVSDGQEIDLPRNELKILSILFEQRGAIVSRDDLMQHLWHEDLFVDDNTLTVNINRLRKKIADAGLNDLIETRRGQGYLVR